MGGAHGKGKRTVEASMIRADAGIHYKENGIPVLSQRRINVIAESIVKDLIPQNFEKQPDATDLKNLFSVLGGWHYAGKYLSKRISTEY